MLLHKSGIDFRFSFEISLKALTSREDQRELLYTEKKEKKIFLINKEFQRDRVQSHIWLTASSYPHKNLRISSYIRKPFLIYDYAPDPI